MPPVQVDVISPLPEGWGICLTCEAMMARANLGKAPYERGLEEYPAEWREDFQRLSALILDLAARYGDRSSSASGTRARCRGCSSPSATACAAIQRL
jgi:hypothetical protein